MSLIAHVSESILSFCWGINVASQARKCKIKKLALAYENLKVDDLHRTIIYVFHIVVHSVVIQ